LGIASFANNTVATATNKWNGYPVANFPVLNIDTDFRNDASKLMARYVWQLSDVRIMPLPAMPIATAKSSGFNLDNYAMWPSNWHIPIGYI
jgi:hypothetical protein